MIYVASGSTQCPVYQGGPALFHPSFIVEFDPLTDIAEVLAVKVDSLNNILLVTKDNENGGHYTISKWNESM
jgi:hypothetical protein